MLTGIAVRAGTGAGRGCLKGLRCTVWVEERAWRRREHVASTTKHWGLFL